jgi:hypothetical protein
LLAQINGDDFHRLVGIKGLLDQSFEFLRRQVTAFGGGKNGLWFLSYTIS